MNVFSYLKSIFDGTHDEEKYKYLPKILRMIKKNKCFWYDRLFLVIPFLGVVYMFFTDRPDQDSIENDFWFLYFIICCMLFCVFVGYIN